MGRKKYISIGISALLALSAGLFTIEGRDVKVGVNGEGARLNTLQKVGTALNELAPYMGEVSAVYRETIDFDNIIEQMGYDGSEETEETKPTYTSAKITMETQRIVNNKKYYETATYYISSDVVYAVIEGFFTYGVEDSNSFAANYFTYKTEIYVDEEYSLIRFSDVLRLEEIEVNGAVFDEMEEIEDEGTIFYEMEMVNIPVGLKKDVWYSAEELFFYDYILYPAVNSEDNISAVGSFISENADKFEFYGKETAMNEINGDNWWYVFFSNEVGTYTSINTIGSGYDELTAETTAYVYMNDEKNPVIVFDYHCRNKLDLRIYSESWKNSIKLENVNATTVKKLKKPKIGKVDTKALKEILEEEYGNELD